MINPIEEIEELCKRQLDNIKLIELKLKELEDKGQQHFKEYFELKSTLKMAKESLDTESIKAVVKGIIREEKLKNILG